MLSNDTALHYYDSRSMLRYDGQTFLCGDCVTGTHRLSPAWSTEVVQLELFPELM